MDAILYEFDRLCHDEKENYIFQFVKKRRLTAVYHSHDFYELICFLRGGGTQSINGERHCSKEGSMLLLHPGDKHCFLEQSKDLELLSLSVRREEFELLAAAYGFSPKERRPIELAIMHVSHLYDLCPEGRVAAECDCKLLLGTFFHVYAREKMTDLPQDSVPIALRQALAQMEKGENLKIGIAALVTLSHYSHSHLARLVKKHFGMGLKEYVNELRLRRAYDDLVFTDETAEVISENLGFSSYSHFYRIFKKRFSLSPSALRRG